LQTTKYKNDRASHAMNIKNTLDADGVPMTNAKRAATTTIASTIAA
jgi:hypothetical protein